MQEPRESDCDEIVDAALQGLSRHKKNGRVVKAQGRPSSHSGPVTLELQRLIGPAGKDLRNACRCAIQKAGGSRRAFFLALGVHFRKPLGNTQVRRAWFKALDGLCPEGTCRKCKARARRRLEANDERLGHAETLEMRSHEYALHAYFDTIEHADFCTHLGRSPMQVYVEALNTFARKEEVQRSFDVNPDDAPVLVFELIDEQKNGEKDWTRCVEGFVTQGVARIKAEFLASALFAYDYARTEGAADCGTRMLSELTKLYLRRFELDSPDARIQAIDTPPPGAFPSENRDRKSLWKLLHIGRKLLNMDMAS